MPLAHIAASMHEGLRGTPAERPGTQDAWLNIIAKHCRSYFGILPAHRDKEAPMIDLNPASVPNHPSCKPHREGSDDGYRGWQGVETGRKRRQIVDRRREHILGACS